LLQFDSVPCKMLQQIYRREPVTPGARHQLAQPDCKACPLWGSNQVWATGNTSAKVALVGDSPGHQETRYGKPFVGPVGEQLNWLLQKARLYRGSVFITNAAMCLPQAVVDNRNGDYTPKAKALKQSIQNCRSRLLQELAIVKPRVVVVFDNEVFEGLTGHRGIQRKQGAVFPVDLQYLAGKRDKAAVREADLSYVIPCLHPKNLLRSGAKHTPAVIDVLRKAKRIAEQGLRNTDVGSYLLVSPFVPDPDSALSQAEYWVDRFIADGSDIAGDVETTRADARTADLTVYGFASAKFNIGVAVSLLTWDNGVKRYFDRWTPEQRARAWGLCAKLTYSTLTKWYWNYGFDVTVLERYFGRVNGCIQDGIHWHWLMQPDLPHGLSYACQTFLDIPPWKSTFHDGEKAGTATDRDLLIYNAQDCLYTAKVTPYLQERVVEAHNQHLTDYQLQVAELARRAHLKGIPINAASWRKLREQYTAEVDSSYQQMVDGIRDHIQELNDYVREVRIKRAKDSAKRRGVKYKEPKVKWIEAEDFNPKSPDQAFWFLYRFLGLQPTKFTKGGADNDKKKQKASTSYKGVLAYLSKPLVKAYVAYAENRHNVTTLDSIKAHSDPETFEQPIWRLHPSWNCFDEHTEVLTNAGFLPIPYVVENIKNLLVAQYDSDDETVSFAAASNPIRRKADDLVHIVSEQVDLMVTAGHRLLFRERPGRNKRVTVLEAQNIQQNRRWVHAGSYTWSTAGLGGCDFVRLLVATQADGSYHNGGWRFNLNKERKYKRLCELLNILQVKYTHKDLGSQLPAGYTCRYSVRLLAGSIAEMLHRFLTSKRLYNRYLLNMTVDEANAFLVEIGKWDGSVEAGNIRYSTTIKKNAEWVQIVATLCGKRAHVRPCINPINYWRVNICPRRSKSAVTSNTLPVKQPGTAYVYCVDVPTTFLIVRRNGKVVIAGNCTGQKGTRWASKPNAQNWAKAMRKLAKQPEGRKWVGADAAQLEYRIAAAFAGIPELIALFNKPPFDEDAEEWKKYSPEYDAHSLVAAEIFADDFLKGDKKTQSALRTAVKRAVYGKFYGATPPTILAALLEDKRLKPEFRARITLELIEQVSVGFDRRFPEWTRWCDRQMYEAKRRGYQEFGPFQRRRHWPVKELEPTKLRNTPIQLAAGDICNFLFVQMQAKVDAEGLDAHFVVHGHDAVYFDCSEDAAPRVVEIVNELFHFWLDGPAGKVHIHGQASIGDTLADVG
jgi:uracil-DNA glycosylase family 4